MNRRGFLTSLAALATTVALPSIPSIPVMSSVDFVRKVMLSSMYGKMRHAYTGGRVYYSAPDGIITADVRSSYPELYGAGSTAAAVMNAWSKRELG